MKLSILPAVVLLAAGLATACGGSSSSNTSSSSNSKPASNSGGAYGATSSSSNPSSGSTAMVVAKKGDLGTILVDAKGRSLYLWEADKSDKSACSGACAQAWPPLTTTAKPQAGSGVQASLLGTTKRDDGTMEVTYDGHPLYYFSGDSAPGDTAGQGNKGFGAEWYVVGPNGKKVEKGES
jgi:predicted lipoprotein with Yx(FWY)xxD motif